VREEFGSTPALDRFGAGGAAVLLAELTDPGGHRRALMDQAGVAVQVQSYSTPHLYHPVDEARARIARAWNDATSEAVAASGGRLAFFATLPLPLVDASLAEIERAKTPCGGCSPTTGWNGPSAPPSRTPSPPSGW
jgi:predicted TIM-barrel fold metal-dependent hydrolase